MSSTSESRAGSRADARARIRRPLAALLAGVLCLSAAASLAAQSGGPSAVPDPSRDASARALFQEGVALVERGELAGAEDLFRRALSLRDSPVIAYNLASTLSERGKLIEGSELLRRLEREPALAPELRQSVAELLAQIAPRIGRLRVTLENAAKTDVVLLNGAALLAVQLDVEIPIDPGSHELQLQRDAITLDSQRIEIGAGASQAVTLNATAHIELTPRAVADASQASAAKAAPVQTQPRATAAKPLTSRWWFWTGIVVIAGASALTIALLATNSAPHAPTFQGDFDPPSVALEVAP